ncbi:MAG TPA: M28 family metallopeptidase [Acidobacteriota bacterium]|nr:M28 family metallopeptidase [Acidobacteriota bacterium]
MPKDSSLPLLILFFFIPFLAAQPSDQDPAETRTPDIPAGYSSRSAPRQLQLEALFGSVPSPLTSRRHHRILTEEPHVEGQPSQRKVAEYILDHFRQSGLQADLAEYQAWLPFPRKVSVRLLEPEERELLLEEKGYELDKDSFSRDVILPYHAYSPSGQVEGEVVYVNYGLPDDYAALRQMGVDVRGKIVLARYGRSFRGVKVKTAEEHGAAGVLIYSDPFDDGYFRGDIFPHGPMRPPSAVQRGSVQYIFVHPGDPLSPGTASTADAEVLGFEEAVNVPRIPSQPLSYEDARPILEALGGHNVPDGWQGGLPFAYHVGPGPSRVRLELEMDHARRPVYNVIARIEGSELPDEWIILGNHIDAWTYGAVDPNSGTTAMLEVASGLGRLLREGFRPRRTIILAGWGGEEYGLIGSTEWGEELAQELSQKAVAYFNVDVGVAGGRFGASAVPALEDLLLDITQRVQDPDTRRAVHDLWLESQNKGREQALNRPDPGDLGSGSDYTVFLDHLGIPSLSMGFGGDYGVYHSLYDSHYWMDQFGDPGWHYHPAIAEIWGRAALRLANAELLPLNYAEYGRAINGYLEDLEKKASGLGGGLIDWAKLKEEASAMERIGEGIRTGMAQILEEGLDQARGRRFNDLLRRAERGFLLSEGLPRRPWFRHSIYAPGYYTGYASQPLPGLAEAVENRDPSQAGQQASLLLRSLREVNRTLDQVRRLTQ